MSVSNSVHFLSSVHLSILVGS
jgi:hypothetical protein